MGRRIAHSLISNNILDYLELSEEHSIVEVRAGEKIAGKSLLELNIRAKYGCNVVAIKEHNKDMNVSPHAEEKISAEDNLINIGLNKIRAKLKKKIIKKKLMINLMMMKKFLKTIF